MRLTVRFSPRTHALIKHEAEQEGVTITQFVREAALARAYLAIGRREDRVIGEMETLMELTRQVLSGEDARRRPSEDAQ